MNLRAMVIILAAAVGAMAFGPPIPSKMASRTVYGRVIDASTGKPIESVPVVVSGAAVGSNSAANGTFSLTNVPGNASRIEFRHPCYLPVQVVVPEVTDVGITIGLPLDQSSRQRPGCGGLGGRE